DSDFLPSSPSSLHYVSEQRQQPYGSLLWLKRVLQRFFQHVNEDPIPQKAV
ncbi:hypothetical protein GBF38_002184, partial [Nibea albiflora]